MDDWPEQRYWKPQAGRLSGKHYAVSFFGLLMPAGHAAVDNQAECGSSGLLFSETVAM